MSDSESYKFAHASTASSQDGSFNKRSVEYFEKSPFSTLEKLLNFPKYCSRQSLTGLLYRYELMQRVLTVPGSIIECGVLYGGGLMAWAKLSAILEPMNYPRKIIGFDTFSGFPSIHENDLAGRSEHLTVGSHSVDSLADLQEAIDLFDSNRFINHIPKVELVKGDLLQTGPDYLKSNPHLLVSLLYLDLDLYEPTKAAIETFLPRMPKGAIIAFDQVNSELWPGETLAVLDTLGLGNLRMERLPFSTIHCFATL